MDREPGIDPSARILGDVTLEAPAWVGPMAVIQGPLRAGPELRVEAGALLGGPAQHRMGGDGSIRLGRQVHVWEAATIHRGSAAGTGVTVVGDRAMLMAYCHLGHDVVLGDGVVLANGVQLGGHCHVGDSAVLGARAALHQFVRVGKGAMVAAGAMVSGDVPPWSMVAGDRARVVGPNRAALPDRASGDAVHRALRLLLGGGASPEDVARELGAVRQVADILEFLAAPSRRPVCGRRRT